MDAASNNGVDDVREIKENVTYSPTDARYKVYIIDEVHMMSSGAFNALLKTLEEPPSYVVFILATTEPHKLPITILSRCQRYDFRRISTEIISDRIREVVTSEQIEIEDKAVSYIAKSAEGGMRDALSLLDQCTAFFLGKKITYERALEVLGAVDTSVFSEFLRDLAARSIVDAFHLIDRILIQGRDLSQFVLEFTWHLRNVLLIKSSKDASEVVDVTADNLALLKQEAAGIPEEQILRYIRIFSELSNSMRYANQKRVVLEIAVIKICKPQMESNLDSLSDRIRVIEEMIESGDLQSVGVATGEVNEQMAAVKNQKNLEREENQKIEALPEATKEDLRNVMSSWRDVIKSLPEMYRACLRTAVPSVRTTDGKLMIQFLDGTVRLLCDDNTFREYLDKGFESAIGKHVDYELVALTETNRKGDYYPPVSVLGMDITIDDSDFD